jgi:hypothetical protein
MIEDRTLDKERRITFEGYKKDFAQSYQAMNKVRIAAQQSLKLLETDNKVSANAVKLLLGRASGNVGNPTDRERELFSGRQDLLSKLERWVQMGATSELPEGDKKELKDLARQYYDVTEEGVKDLAEMKALQLKSNELFKDEDPNKLVNAITGGRVQQVSSPGAPPPPPPLAPASKYFKPLK